MNMKLDRYLKKEKLSSGEFAAKIGVAAWTVERYIAGRVPDPKIVEAIHAATHGKVTPNDFYDLQPRK